MRKSLYALIFLFGLSFTLQLLPGCCPDEPVYCDKITTAGLTAMRTRDGVTVSSIDEPIPADELVLRLAIYRDRKLCARQRAFSLMSTAYATFDCAMPEDIRDSVRFISIKSKSNWGSQYPSGAELNEMFRIPELNKPNYNSDKTDIDIFSKGVPDSSSTHVFEVLLFLQNGDTVFTHSETVALVR